MTHPARHRSVRRLAGAAVVVAFVTASASGQTPRLEFESFMHEELTLGVDPWWGDAAGQPADARPRPAQPAQARLATVRRGRGLQSLQRELSVIRAIEPSLDPPTRAKILAAGRKAVEDQASGTIPLVGGVEAALERVLGQVVGPASAAAYRGELEARAARRKAAAIAVLVESIDRDALLDHAGRAALAAALRERWQPEWETVVAAAQRQRIGESRLPAGVTEAAAIALDGDTWAAWRRRVREAE